MHRHRQTHPHPTATDGAGFYAGGRDSAGGDDAPSSSPHRHPALDRLLSMIGPGHRPPGGPGRNLKLKRALLASCLIATVVATVIASPSFRDVRQYRRKGYTELRKSRPLPPAESTTDAAMLRRGSGSDSVRGSNKLVVDIVSIGSTSRPDYLAAQNETWVRREHHGVSVRNFFGMTEEHHKLANDTCDGAFLLDNAQRCLEQSNDTAVRRGVLIYNNLTGRPAYAKLWYCAQKRPAVGLGRVVADRYFDDGHNTREELPDWLLLVDDDSSFRMGVFRTSLSQLDPSRVYVMAGRHIPFDFPYGGWGTVLSRGALERLYRPLHCNFDAPFGIGMARSGGGYGKHACSRLRMNTADELSFFVDGDTLANLMLKIATGQHKGFEPSAEGGDDVMPASRRTPFCYHSDWLSGYFFSHYLLMGHTIPLYPSCPGALRCWIPAELLPNDREISAGCWKDPNLIACHYQTPEMMRMTVDNATN